MFPRDPHTLYPHDKFIAFFFDPIIPRFVKPNHITIFRFLATPVVLFFLLERMYVIGVWAFILVAFTDVLDGTLARVRKQVTDWGMRYDPLADKILIGSVLIIILFRYVNPILATVLLVMDVIAIIAGVIRTMRGESIVANRWGKAKMFLQVIGVAALLIGLALDVHYFVPFSTATFVLAIIFAVISLLSYGI